ncbi:MAG: hypothetical protein ACRDR6_12435 [Pseudonocardiaceae bacterium]
MGPRAFYEDATEAYQLPRVVRLAPNLFAVCFTLMKMIPARYILRRALREGLLAPGTIINRLAEIRGELPATFCPEQYSNPDNPRSYAVVAELLVEALGQVDCVVGPIGSGGSTGNSLMPPSMDHRVFDCVHWCTAAEAYRATRHLHRRHALFMGPTSGAAYLVGRWWARKHPGALTVVLMPDEGYRYLDTVYDDAWLAAQGYGATVLPDEPLTVRDPTRPGSRWTAYDWGKRSYTEVMAAARDDLVGLR